MTLRPGLQRTVKQRATDGAHYLDKALPGWEALINVDTLNINSSHYCVLGQIYKLSYTNAAQKQFGKDWAQKGRMYGFTVPFAVDGNQQEYADLLTETWRKLVVARRNKGEVQPTLLTVTKLAIERHVREGALWLDRRQPEWHARINLDTLDMFTATDCVLAQTYGIDAYQVAALEALNDKALVAFGLQCPQRYVGTLVEEEYYKVLTIYWTDIVKERRMYAQEATQWQ